MKKDVGLQEKIDKTMKILKEQFGINTREEFEEYYAKNYKPIDIGICVTPIKISQEEIDKYVI